MIKLMDCNSLADLNSFDFQRWLWKKNGWSHHEFENLLKEGGDSDHPGFDGGFGNFFRTEWSDLPHQN